MSSSSSLVVLALLAAAGTAHAAPGAARFTVDWSDRPLDELNPADLDAWLEHAVGASPADATHVELMVKLSDGRVVTAESLRPTASPLPADVLPSPPPPAGIGVDHPGESAGALSGKTVYVSQCHGWIWYDTLGRFSTQRGNLYSTVEDFHNPEGADAYLVRYLENAGARVVTARERDHNPLMVIVDDSDTAYTESGSGFEAGSSGFGHASTWAYGHNPFESGSSRRFPADSGASATFVPDVPENGEYSVYISYVADPSNDPAAHVRITHPGGVIDRSIDQTVHGSTWVYLETLWLEEGPDSLKVELVGDGTAGRWLSADAVRIGGGMGDVERYGTLTGRPRWEEGAILYTQWNGAPTSSYNPYGGSDGSDPSARSRYAAWRSPPGEDAVYLSWHSNAGGGTGTSTYTYEGSSGPAAAGSQDLGQFVQDEIVSAFRALWVSDWTDRGTRTAAFSEVSPYHNPDMPAALVELAFHDHEVDVEYLKEPVFRQDAARAMTRGIVRYFANRDGTTPAFLPEAPAAISVRHQGSDLVVEWTDGPVGDPFGDAPESWTVYTSLDGRSWDNGTPTTDRSAVLDIPPGETRFVRVSAHNAGGESFPSEVAGARRMPSELPPVLIVAAYDRLDSGLLTREDVPVLGELRRMTDVHRLNPFDVIARHGRAIRDAGWYFDSVSDDFLPELDLSGYRAVVWAAGEESTADESFSTAQQAQLQAYVDGGGTLWSSGSEVLWDLDYRGSEADQAFADNVLGARMADDDAGVEEAYGADILEGITMGFSEADGAPYPIEYPDVLVSDRTVIALYDSTSPAAVYGDGVVHFGFPVESIGDEVVRTEVAARVLDALMPDWEPPDLSDPGDPDPDSGTSTDTGTPTGANDTDSAAGASPGDRTPLSKMGGCGCSSAMATAPYRGAWMLGLVVLVYGRRRSGEPVQADSRS